MDDQLSLTVFVDDIIYPKPKINGGVASCRY